METNQLKTFSKLQKLTIIDAIHNDDLDFLFDYFQHCTPYQVAEWLSNESTPTYISLYLDYCFSIFKMFEGVYIFANLAMWGNWEREDSISKGYFTEEDFMPQDHEDFHLTFQQVIGISSEI